MILTGDLLLESLRMHKLGTTDQIKELTRRQAFLDGSIEIVKRAEAAKMRGDIKSYLPIFRADDPAIVDHIQIEGI